MSSKSTRPPVERSTQCVEQGMDKPIHILDKTPSRYTIIYRVFLPHRPPSLFLLVQQWLQQLQIYFRNGKKSPSATVLTALPNVSARKLGRFSHHSTSGYTVVCSVARARALGMNPAVAKISIVTANDRFNRETSKQHTSPTFTVVDDQSITLLRHQSSNPPNSSLSVFRRKNRVRTVPVYQKKKIRKPLTGKGSEKSILTTTDSPLRPRFSR